MKIKPNVPMAVQACNILRKRLREETFEGNRLPGELAIAEDLGISRGTVRQALAMLEQEGVITRHQGSGTFVNPHILQIGARVDVAYEFSELIQAFGFEPEIEMVDVRQQMASTRLAEQLDIEPGSQVMAIEKVFLASNEPAIHAVEYIPASLVKESFEEDDLYQPIFAFLERHCDALVDYILSEIIPCNVDEQLAARIQVEPGTAVLLFEEVMYSPENLPLCFVRAHFRRPLIRFHALRKLTQVR
ncbi:MAG: GntR family transcriptional regulator [Caldilineaceae bacterium]|nr:GntR family transcriptional regulator [Caldilineaceae bacterium]